MKSEVICSCFLPILHEWFAAGPADSVAAVEGKARTSEHMQVSTSQHIDKLRRDIDINKDVGWGVESGAQVWDKWSGGWS